MAATSIKAQHDIYDAIGLPVRKHFKVTSAVVAHDSQHHAFVVPGLKFESDRHPVIARVVLEELVPKTVVRLVFACLILFNPIMFPADFPQLFSLHSGLPVV